MTRFSTAVFLAFLLLAALPARAEWPYLTEGAATLGQNRAAVSVGIGRTERQEAYRQFGVLLTPPKGTLWSLPEVQGRLGIGPRAEVSFDYAYYYLDPKGPEKSTYESGDLRFWTKLGLLRGPTHAVSVRFGVKVPTASDGRGIGTDEADVFWGFLGDLALGPVRLTGNLGMGILGDPTKSQHQDDVVTWGGLARVPVGGGFGAGAEASGYLGPFGIHRERHFTTLAAVIGWQGERPFRLDVAARKGIEDDRYWELLGGVTYTTP